MATFDNSDRVNNGTVTELIGSGSDDTITLSSTFLLSGATTGLIDGGGGNDRLELASSNLSNTTITGIESTALTNNGLMTIEADQVANLGALTLENNAATFGGNIRLNGQDGDVADFSGLSLLDTHRLFVSTTFLSTGVGITVDFSGGSFAGNSFIDFDGGNSWRFPIGWSGLIVSASSVSGPLERCFRARADDSPMSCAA